MDLVHRFGLQVSLRGLRGTFLTGLVRLDSDRLVWPWFDMVAVLRPFGVLKSARHVRNIFANFRDSIVWSMIWLTEWFSWAAAATR